MKTALLSCCLLLTLATFAQTEERQAIEQIIVSAYVEGVFVNRDAGAVQTGFHPDFLMHVYADGQLIQAPLAMWLERMGLDNTKNPKPVKHEFDSIDITGNAATVKMRIYEDGTHLYTDYLGLYRFDHGWRIVNKIFFGHD